MTDTSIKKSEDSIECKNLLGLAVRLENRRRLIKIKYKVKGPIVQEFRGLHLSCKTPVMQPCNSIDLREQCIKTVLAPRGWKMGSGGRTNTWPGGGGFVAPNS